MTPECIGELHALAETSAREDHIPSISWGIVVDDELVHHGAVGQLDDGTRPTADTVYRIASMTKSFTAATVLALRDEGVWSLDDPIANHAPELGTVIGPPGSAPITLRHVLSMTSGLASDDPWADRHLDISPDDIDRIYAAGPLFARRPNDGYEYSNLGYAMLGRAILRATGRRAQTHIRERFLQPLAMHRTTWAQPPHDNWARPYRTQDGQIVRDEPEPIGDGDLAPMGGLWTTVADLATWVAWFDAANRRPDSDDDVGLSPASRREMQRIHTYAGVTTVAGHTCPGGYGFGLNVRDDPTLGMMVAHAGGLPGYGSNMRWFAGRGVGVIALANSFYAPMSALTMRMLAVLQHHGEVPPVADVSAPQWRAAAERLVALLNAWNDRDAAGLFADNVALDETFARRRAHAAALIGTHGPLRITGLRPHSKASGDIDVRGSGQALRIHMELSPAPNAPVQAYSIHK